MQDQMIEDMQADLFEIRERLAAHARRKPAHVLAGQEAAIAKRRARNKAARKQQRR